MNPTEEQYAGCFLGLALGDALGAPFEGGLIERALWRVIGQTKDQEARFTDDTQMALDLANSLIRNKQLNQSDLSQAFANSYHWSRGYGPSTARLLKRIRKGESWEIANKTTYPQGSFGNGAAMRAPIMALFLPENSRTLTAYTQLSAQVTHTHSLGIEGAVLIAQATAFLLQHPANPLNLFASLKEHCHTLEFSSGLQIAEQWLVQDYPTCPKEVAKLLGNGMTAVRSCVTALYCALRFLDSDFLTLLKFIKSLRGDVDTISAMAGALWGAYHSLEQLPNSRIEQRVQIIQVAQRLYQLHRKGR
ncbi:MAG: hypothetical protein E6Q83_18405 [Thiothrix sp.]|nr:MAG: hypothetical protein E6Q83_18405 [Thiothrix sp.]